MKPQIFTLHNQILEAVLPEAAFPFLSDGKKHTIAIVGGGGKTTLMYFLGDTYAKQNIPTLITTTTHIRMPEDGSYVTTMAAACRRWEAQSYAVVGVPDQGEKLKALPETELHAYQKRAKQILVEADGAKMRPCKVPAEHEPVIPKECDIVIAVAGLDVLGETIEAGCFRSRQVAAFLQKPLLHRIEEADLVKILLSEQGARKSVGKREYYVVLNKCDTQERMHRAQKIAVALQQAGMQHIAVTKLKDTDNEENNG